MSSAIATWLSKIIPSFGNKDLQQKIRNVSSKNSDILRPVFQQFMDTFKKTDFTTAHAKRFVQMYKTRTFTQKSVFDTMGIVIDNIDALCDQLEDYSKKHFTTNINVEALTFQQASVLRLIDVIDFVVDYSVRALDHLATSEINVAAFGEADGPVSTKAERTFLENNLNGFLDALQLLAREPKQVIHEIEKIPAVIVINTDVSTVPGLDGHSDPLKLDAIPVISKIFYWFAIRKVDYDIERWERLKKIRRNVEFRIEALRAKQVGEPNNARHQVYLEKYDRELVVLNDKIARLEDMH